MLVAPSPPVDRQDPAGAVGPFAGVVGLVRAEDDDRAPGFGLRSRYVERFWLPLLGPSATLLVRHLDDALDDVGDDRRSRGRRIVPVDFEEIARCLGLGGAASRHGAMSRTLARCVRFGFARPEGPDLLSIRRRCTLLSSRQAARLPATLRAAHASWTEPSRSEAGPSSDELRWRARTRALELAGRGLTREEIERRLSHCGLHPALAFDVASWVDGR